MKWFLLFLCVSVVLSSESKKSYQITFPGGDTFSYAKLYGTIDRPLEEFTLCHWSKTNVNDGKFASIFSYNTENLDNTILTMIQHNNKVHFQRTRNLIKEATLGIVKIEWLHTCVTWSVVGNSWQIFVNGEIISRGKGPAGFPPAQANGVIILGQEQDQMEAAFDINQALTGHVSEIHLWDYVLTPNEVFRVSSCNYADEGNIINWNQATWALYNGSRISPVRLPCGQPQ